MKMQEKCPTTKMFVKKDQISTLHFRHRYTVVFQYYFITMCLQQVSLLMFSSLPCFYTVYRSIPICGLCLHKIIDFYIVNWENFGVKIFLDASINLKIKCVKIVLQRTFKTTKYLRFENNMCLSSLQQCVFWCVFLRCRLDATSNRRIQSS